MRDAFHSLVIIAGYMGARHLVYLAIPATDLAYWFERDLWMTIPRLGAFIFCLALIHRRGGLKLWGWNFKTTWPGLAILALITFMELLLHMSVGLKPAFPPWMRGLGWLASAPVALFEEAAFRSLLFLSLRKEMPAVFAALLSSLIFTVFHVEAQTISITWPQLFAFGLGTCAALHCGVGIWPLVAAHWIVDGAWYHFGAGPASETARTLGTIAPGVSVVVSLALLRDSKKGNDEAVSENRRA